MDKAIKYITELCYGLTDQESIKALARGMFENNKWLEKMGIEPNLWKRGESCENKLYLPYIDI
jgi:hypothetical protein